MAKRKGKVVVRILKTRFDELELLARKGRGRLRPEAVVRFATDPRTLLHKVFEWDNTKAAARYRVDQARDLIASYEVVIKGPAGPAKVRAFYSLPSDRKDRAGYRRTVDIVKDKRLLRELITSALNDVRRVEDSFRAVRALDPLWAAAARIGKRHGVRKAA